MKDENCLMSDWFTIDEIDHDTYIISEYRHWDHIGGLKYFPDFYAHEAEVGWLEGEFPLSEEAIRKMVVDRCDLPKDFDS